MKQKKSFIFYSDWIDTFKELPKDKGYDLLMHILSYVNDENPKTDDFIIKALFANMKNTLKRDLQKWEEQRKQRSEAGKKSAEIRRTKFNERSTVVNERTRKPTVSVSVSDSVSVNVNDIKKEFNIFWNKYHLITNKQKTDKEPAFKHWNKLNKEDKIKAIENIQLYYNSLKDTKYCKKARTYLADKNFNDEFNIKNNGFRFVQFKYFGQALRELKISEYEKIKDKIKNNDFEIAPKFVKEPKLYKNK